MRVDRDQVKVAVAVAVLLAVGVGVYMPERHERQQLEERQRAAEVELNSGQATVSELRRLNEDVLRLRTLTSQPGRYVPEENELAEAISGVTESLVEGGATVQAIEVSDPNHFRDYSIIPVDVAFTASFPGAYGVLTRLEAMPRLVRFDDVRVSAAEGGRSAPVSVELKLSAFFSPVSAAGLGGAR